MKFQVLYATFGLVSLVGGALVTTAGCTTTTTVGNGDGGNVDIDTGTTEDAGVDTGIVVTDAATCGAISFGDQACDTCVQTSCCSALAACDVTDSSGTDDAGRTACEQILVCATAYCMSSMATQADASLDECLTTCDGPYTPAEQQTTATLTNCIQANCSTQCGAR